MHNTAIKTQGLSKRYQIGVQYGYKTLRETLSDAITSPFRREEEKRGPDLIGKKDRNYVWALRDVSFDVSEGEIVGIIGSNGAGKTTLLRILSRITPPTEGYAEIHGRVGSLLNIGAGFHPELTGRENIFLNGAILGMKKDEISRKLDEIISFAGVGDFLDAPVKYYSEGMYVRLAFAVAAHLEPDILLVDEVLAVGDAAFQKKSLGRMGDAAKEGRTVLLVSHNMTAILSLCQRACLFEGGKLVTDGKVREVVENYLLSASSSAVMPLDQRTDRSGDGSIRLVSLQIENVDESKVIGCTSRLKIRIGYSSHAIVRYPRFIINILDYTNGGVFELDSDMVGGLPSEIPPEGSVTCVTAPINITPGRCYVSVSALRTEIPADTIENAGYFDVFPEDAYGSGKVPDRESALCLVGHSWTLAGD